MSKDYTEKIGNKYILLDLIGTGGMAEVYRCKLSGSQGFEKIIVLKKLLPQVAQDKEIVENFIAEARLAALLQHENIVSIYDFGELDGSYFIAMEYLFGKDLHTIMQRAKDADAPMGPEQALLIATKICEGMEYAHSLKDLQYRPLNLIHRDLSPHNVFITYDGKVKIIDFGIAKAELYDNRTRAGVVKGKLSYMSPEQLAGDSIDLRSDIFAIGILLYEMLSGKRMYSGDTATLIRKCMQVDYAELEQVSPDLQKGVYDILRKALQKDRNKRYHSCADMRSDIDDCLFNMRQRVDGKILQHYVRRVLNEEYEVEKEKLSRGEEQNNQNCELTEIAPMKTEHFSRTDTVLMDKTVYEEYSEENEKKIPLESKSREKTGVFRYWKRLLLVLIVVGTVFSVFQLADLKIQKKLEPVPEVVVSPEQQVKPVTLPLAKLPVAQKNIQVAQKPVVVPVEKKGTAVLTEEIESLLKKAQQAFAANRLIRPGYNSSYKYLQKVLELDTDNRAAREGIHRIGSKYAQLAERALKEDNYAEAGEFITMGLIVTPQDSWLLSLQDKVELVKQKKIRELFLNAQQALDRNDLTTPENDCAYKYYQDILEIEKENSHALNGLRVITNRYAELAEEAYINFNLTNAKSFVRKGLAIDPRHRKLLELERDLDRSKPMIFLKSLEKSIEPLKNLF